MTKDPPTPRGLADSMSAQRVDSMAFYAQLLTEGPPVVRSRSDVVDEAEAPTTTDEPATTHPSPDSPDGHTEAAPATTQVTPESPRAPLDERPDIPGPRDGRTDARQGSGANEEHVRSEDDAPVEARRAAVLPETSASGRRDLPPRAGARIRRLPAVPDSPELPPRLDATYVPRQLFLRVSPELRDRVRRYAIEHGSRLRLTDGEVLERVCRRLPLDPVELGRLYGEFVLQRDHRKVTIAPYVREELSDWLEVAVSGLLQAGVKANVSVLAQVALDLIDRADPST